MKILGINLNHISSAALISNSEIVAATSEERISRIKLSREFPDNSIKFCLNQANISFDDLDAITIGWNPGINLEIFKKSYSYTYRWFPELLYLIPNQILKLNNASFDHYILQEFKSINLKKNLKIIYVNHHLSHAALSFLSSGFKNSGILTVDGFGERTSTMWGKADKNKIEISKKIDFPQSLGSFYETITSFLGFTPDSDEWKVMGMAAYGDKNIYLKKLQQLIKLKNSGEYEIDLSYFNYFNFESPGHFNNKFVELFKDIPLNRKNLNKRHYDFAASAQSIFEDVMFNAISHLTKGNLKNICLSGGSIMNCLANARIAKKFKQKIFVPFAPDDLGLSIGSAMYANQYIFKKRRKYEIKPYTGREFSDREIESKLKKYKISYFKSKSFYNTLALELSRGKVISVVSGKSEFGQRALGNRSILADPRSIKMKDIVNQKIKYRESFRPFAPVVLSKFLNKYFNCPPNIQPTYMQYAVEVKKITKKIAPAIVHADNTARVQSVNENTNKNLNKILEEFFKITKVPILLNTSFNLKGEPMVDSPEDAIKTFYTSGIDILAINNYIITKEK